MYGEMQEYKVSDQIISITQIVPAQGWLAAFVDVRGDGSPFIYSEPIACWGLETVFDNHYSLSPIATRVVGLIPEFGMISAQDLENFVSYCEVGTNLEEFMEYGLHILEHIKEDNEDTDEE